VLAHAFFDASEQPHDKLTASIGVAQLHAADDEHGDSLIARAGHGMQAAKQAGQNRVCTIEAAPPTTVEAPRFERIS
jgi:PleD family two-component response regulator